MSGEIREGFLCPVCMLPCNSVEHLEAHFNANHFNAPSKKKSDSDTSSGNGTRFKPGHPNSIDIYLDDSWQVRQVGVRRSHFDEFKKLRNNFMNPRAIESNKTLMRLTKLLANTEIPLNADARKEFERSIVAWVKDEDVPICPSCGRQFNVVLRRRHHCRLCGAIMCSPCSLILTSNYANNVIIGCRDGESLSGPALEELTDSEILPPSQLSESVTDLRICDYCARIMRRLATSIIRNNTSSAVELLYSKLTGKMNEVTTLRPRYMQAVNCMQKGESDYTFTEATEMREKLLKNYQIIESLSTKIEKLFSSQKSEDSSTSQAQHLKVATSVRRNAQLFLQQNLYALQTLPSREAYQLQRHNRKTALEQKIDREQKEAARYFADHSNRTSLDNTPRTSPSRGSRALSSITSPPARGWLPTPASSTAVSEEEDPIVTQIRQVEHYISQARQAGKMDEVAILQENLQHLKSCLL